MAAACSANDEGMLIGKASAAADAPQES